MLSSLCSVCLGLKSMLRTLQLKYILGVTSISLTWEALELKNLRLHLRSAEV